MAKQTNEKISTAFDQLKKILNVYAKKMAVEKNEAELFQINSKKLDAKGKPVMFGAAAIRKNTANFYFMPIYTHPELKKSLSKDLLSRMQGKSCFNFKQFDKELFTDLKKLTEKGFKLYQKEKII